ncbi:protein kinase [Leptolyngbya sp. FACHB-36]|uniref:serine/threonine-protein kinase n=1 Tax=Leptolyngbya sp. FACHB-36 TaxID=2692808 RepID=UPI001680A68D|nr:serine/threonine-protein kinase [Leptolyngbya sp. FACHB-36]MBD2019105.1 protein kinase [Leptolyngbya sp. FACHB-36]
MQSVTPSNQPLLNNRYRILQTLGAGGFGETFLAEDTHLPSRRRCVIKRLIPVSNSPQLAQQVHQRFEREAVILEQLGEHPQIPDLYAYFESTGQYYLVQEWIDGVTLTQQVQATGVLPEATVRSILVSLLPVLEFVHSRQMVHRDIKPDNIILRSRDQQPVLIDFGAVKEAMGTVVNSQGHAANTVVIGTPGYMPGEQAGGRPTYSSDLYALGLTAIFLLTGKSPEALQTDPHTSELLWRQAAPTVSPQLAMVLDRSIRLHPSQRFYNAQEMLHALQFNAPQSAASVPSTIPTVAVAPGVPAAVPPRQTASPRQTAAGRVIQAPRRSPLLVGLVLAGLAFGAGAAAIGLLKSPPAEAPVAQEPSTPLSESPTTPIAQASPQEPPQERPAPAAPSREPSPTASTPTPTPTPTPAAPEPPSKPTTSVSTVGFPVGTPESTVRQTLGEPTASAKGFWQNTRAVRYEDYVPGEVSLGYLFDNDTGKLRQTEAAFAQSVGADAMLQALDGMMNSRTSNEIRQGLQRVYDRQANQYSFQSGGLKGVVERNDRDRIYVGVWDADLH